MSVPYTDYDYEPAKKKHPRGIQPLIPRPGGVTLEEIAASFEMSVTEVCELTFGTADVDAVKDYLDNDLGYLDAKVTEEFNSIYVFLYDAKSQPMTGDYRVGMLGTVFYDPGPPPPSLKPQPAKPTVAIQALSAKPVVNTVNRDFLDGDILLTEHPVDIGLQELTLAWPSHAGIVVDEEKEKAGDAMPGRGSRAVESIPIRSSGAGVADEEIFLNDDTLNKGGSTGACLVYRYKGGGNTGKGKTGSKKSKSKTASPKDSKKPADTPRELARKAARWTRAQTQKPYKFTLESNIIGVKESLFSRKLRKTSKGEFIVPDKTFAGACPKCGLHKGSTGCCNTTIEPYLGTGKVGVCTKCQHVETGTRAANCTCGGTWMVICTHCGELDGAANCCRWEKGATLTDRETGKSSRSTYYASRLSLRKSKANVHVVYCSELVWRAYRFGAGVTLVEPKKFFNIYDHPDRFVYWLLKGQRKDGVDVEKRGSAGAWRSKQIEKIAGAFLRISNTKKAQKLLINLARSKHSGYVLAPFQLGKSKFVEEKHKIEAWQDKHKETKLVDRTGANIHPASVLGFLDESEREEQRLDDNKEALKNEVDLLEAAHKAAEQEVKKKQTECANCMDFTEMAKLDGELDDLKKARDKIAQEYVTKFKELEAWNEEDEMAKFQAKQYKTTPKTYSVHKPWD